MAMSYGHVYVAQISMGANKVQAIKALKDANSKINSNNSNGDSYGQI